MTLNLLRPGATRHRYTGRCDNCGKWTCAPAAREIHGVKMADADGRAARVCASCRRTLAAYISLQDAVSEADARATLAALMAAPPVGRLAN